MSFWGFDGKKGANDGKKGQTKKTRPFFVRLSVASPETEDIPKRRNASHGRSKSCGSSLLNSSAEIHIRHAPELANTRRLHATELATTSTIMFPQLDSAIPAKDEPPRWARTKLLMVFPRFCRIAPMEHISFVPESTLLRRQAWHQLCNILCMHRHLLPRSSKPIVDHTCQPHHKHSDGCNLNTFIFGFTATLQKLDQLGRFAPRPQRTEHPALSHRQRRLSCCPPKSHATQKSSDQHLKWAPSSSSTPLSAFGRSTQRISQTT